ncbi:MAG: diaminopimelate decarboxylase [Dehalococcoidia bacterium]|nr:diaminopimelate decarboxylase [Dehalococcoidia bacterium]
MKYQDALHKLTLFPDTAGVNQQGHLTIGGCDAVQLAAIYGTPLYVFDEATIRAKCSEYRQEFGQRYPNTLAIYACKAFTSQALIRILDEEGLGFDVVSGGEMHIAMSAGVPLDKVYFHGNNKGEYELKKALEAGIGRVVVDNFHELALLPRLCGELGKTQDILLRLSPGVDPHTHKHVATGILDSKFGFPIATGQAEEALRIAVSTPNLRLIGLHFHLGSSLFEVEPYVKALEIVLNFAARMKQQHRFELRELNIGGGFPAQYLLNTPAPPVSVYAEAVVSALMREARRLRLKQPRLIIEPGRSIVAKAGTALYKIGGSKDIPGVRRYVFVDGGMADNIRPALYDSKYEAVVANKMGKPETDVVTIAGKFCESGDILIKDVRLPKVEAGDILAMPTSGAYSIPMSSNYNASLRPAIVMVKDGSARLIRRRETYDDLTARDSV